MAGALGWARLKCSLVPSFQERETSCSVSYTHLDVYKRQPKTHNPGYEALIKERLAQVLRDSAQPIHRVLSEEAAQGLLRQSFDYGRPWFGQLMAGPQLLAYLLQVNAWLLRYHIYLDI